MTEPTTTPEPDPEVTPEPVPESADQPAADDSVLQVILRVDSPWVHRFVGSRGEDEFPINADGVEVPADAVDDLIEQAAGLGVVLVRVEG